MGSAQGWVYRIFTKVDPIYPEGADSFLDRDVVLRVLLDRTGSVVRSEPLSGHRNLGLAASKAVSAWQFEPIEIDQQKLPVVCQLRLRFTAEGGMDVVSGSILNLAMDELGELRGVSSSSFSEEEIFQRIRESQTSTHIYVSEDTPFDVVQEKVRLLEQLGSAHVELTPGALSILDERLYYNAHFEGLRSPEIAPEDLRNLRQRARGLLDDPEVLLYRIFSDANGHIVSVEHREGPRLVEIESQLVELTVTPGRLGVDPVPAAFLLRLEPFHEGMATKGQLILAEASSRRYAFREGRLFYTHRTDGVLPPQVDHDYLSNVADRTLNHLDSPAALRFRLFCDETGRVVSIERLGGAHLPQIEADLSRAVVSPGTLEGTPVPVAFLLSFPSAEPQIESTATTQSEWTYDEFMRQDWRSRKVILRGLPWEKASELKQTQVHRYLARGSAVLHENQLRLIGDYLTYLQGEGPEHLPLRQDFRNEVVRYFTDRDSRSIFSLNGDPIPKND